MVKPASTKLSINTSTKLSINKLRTLIGTSGWSYDHWEGPFYPQGLPQTKRLIFYTQHFSTIELNASFYRLPQKSTFAKWRASTPKDFTFAIKASRFLTHVKKLNEPEEPWKALFERAKALAEKLGPVLFQFPPNWRQNLERLDKFLKILPEGQEYAFEFRHPSWFNQSTYQLLRSKRTAALCIADSPRYPCFFEITAPFTFIRMHGGQELYGSKYSDRELEKLAQKIRQYQKEGLKIYVYFNNDAYGYAIENALRLREILSGK